MRSWLSGLRDRASGKVFGKRRVLFFVADGMRLELMERYAGKASCPLFEPQGDWRARRERSIQAFPPNSGVGWYTLATGAFPAQHGVTNNTFHRGEDDFNHATSWFTPGVLQADTLAAAAERAGQEGRSDSLLGGRSAKIAAPRSNSAIPFPRRACLPGR